MGQSAHACFLCQVCFLSCRGARRCRSACEMNDPLPRNLYMCDWTFRKYGGPKSDFSATVPPHSKRCLFAVLVCCCPRRRTLSSRSRGVASTTTDLPPVCTGAAQHAGRDRSSSRVQAPDVEASLPPNTSDYDRSNKDFLFLRLRSVVRSASAVPR